MVGLNDGEKELFACIQRCRCFGTIKSFCRLCNKQKNYGARGRRRRNYGGMKIVLYRPFDLRRLVNHVWVEFLDPYDLRESGTSTLRGCS